MLGKLELTEDDNEQDDVDDAQQGAEVARTGVHVEAELYGINLESLVAQWDKR